VAELFARLPLRSPEPERRARPEAARDFLDGLGPRLRDATFENFRPPGAEAEKVLRALRDYAARLDENVARGRGVVLFGPCGTGKDHLLIALARLAAARGHSIRRTTGPELFRVIRDAMADGAESRFLDRLKYAGILILSDPLPPLGGLTPFQAAVLYDLVNYRWEYRLPTWVTLNVADSREADSRLGPAIVDRLQDGAVVLKCGWASHRRPVSC